MIPEELKPLTQKSEFYRNIIILVLAFLCFVYTMEEVKLAVRYMTVEMYDGETGMQEDFR